MAGHGYPLPNGNPMLEVFGLGRCGGTEPELAQRLLEALLCAAAGRTGHHPARPGLMLPELMGRRQTWTDGERGQTDQTEWKRES